MEGQIKMMINVVPFLVHVLFNEESGSSYQGTLEEKEHSSLRNCKYYVYSFY